MNIEMIHAAADRAKGHIRQTPLLSSPFLDELAGRRVWVKAECLQHTGSFKARGAWSALSAMSPETRAKGVIAYSSGNHAQGVAWAAQEHGASAVIVMPYDAPQLKIENTCALGAEVVLYDRYSEDRDAIGQQIAADRGLTLIRPYDEPLVIAGQGTVGLEIAAQTDVTQADVLVCCGGGGLTSGIALALADTGLTVRPVEPENYDDVTRSLKTGSIQHNKTPPPSICDAIVTPAPGNLIFPILRDHCGAGIVVSDHDALRAMALAFQRLKIVVEPGGAVALAAALFHADQISGDDVIVVTTGGNVDADMMAKALKTL